MIPKPTNFLALDYLAHGSAIQQRGYAAIRECKIFDLLHSYQPVLAGTLPLDLYTPTSDLDILCCTPDTQAFFEFAKKEFSLFDQFRIYQTAINDEDVVIVNFRFNDFTFEVFAQKIPVAEQNAYKHLLIEHEILLLRGKEFRDMIMDLKRKGVKTEPAFAYLLQLKGDPYEALLRYELPV